MHSLSFLRARSFLSDLRRSWQIFFYAFATLLCIGVLGFLFFVQGRAVLQQEIKERLKSTAAAAALQFQGKELDAFHTPADMTKPGFHVLLVRLQAIAETVPNIQSVYIMRPTQDPLVLSFVADPDALLSDAQRDKNSNGTVDPDEVAPQPGDPYEIGDFPAMREAFLHPAVDEELTTDQWGTVISGYAPIHDARGKAVAILGLDMSVHDYETLSQSILSPVAFILVVLAASCIAGFVLLFLWQRRIEALRKVDQERQGMMILLSHQLGTPLTIFKWSLESLKERDPGTTLEDEVHDHVGRMEKGISYLTAVMDAVSQANQVQSGTILYQPEKMGLLSVLTTALQDTAARFDQEKKTARRVFDRDVTVHTDPQLLRAVIRELITNALDFSPPQSAITIRTVNHLDVVQVDVQDEGEGIPMSDLTHMFEKFTRGSNAPRYKPDGNGLGLFIAKGLIERAGGRIWVESKVGKGTTVSFTLPIV